MQLKRRQLTPPPGVTKPENDKEQIDHTPTNDRPIGIIIVGVVIVFTLFGILGSVLFLLPRSLPHHPETMILAELMWMREETVEEELPVDGQGWIIPVGAEVLQMEMRTMSVLK